MCIRDRVLITTIRDNGHGMDRNGLQSFFDLGNSLRRGCKTAIGEKGHGTKVYLNSEKIEVCTVCNGVKYIAVMDSPNRKLHNRQLPEVIVQTETCSEENGTTIHIRGYNHCLLYTSIRPERASSLSTWMIRTLC